MTLTASESKTNYFLSRKDTTTPAPQPRNMATGQHSVASEAAEHLNAILASPKVSREYRIRIASPGSDPGLTLSPLRALSITTYCHTADPCQL